jgi:hypothetical protein
LLGHILGTPTPAPDLDAEDLLPRISGDTPKNFSSFRPALVHHSEDIQFVAVDPTGLSVQFGISLEFYSRVCIGKKAQSYRLSETISLHITKRDDAILEIARHGLDILLSCMGIANVVRVLRAALLEQKIVFFGKDINTVTCSALCVLPLVVPLSYKCAMMPYLPDVEEYLAFLESPVPFCFGILNSDRSGMIRFDPDVTVVHLDERRVTYPDNVPHLPKAELLRLALKELLHSGKVCTPKGRPDDADFWKKRERQMISIAIKRRLRLKYSFCPGDVNRIMSVFSKYVSEFVKPEKLCACRVRDTTDSAHPKIAFVKQVYMIGLRPRDTDFFESFLQTQAFFAYFEKAVVEG